MYKDRDAEGKEEEKVLYSKDIGGLCMASWCRNKVDVTSGVCGREASAEEIGCEKGQELISGLQAVLWGRTRDATDDITTVNLEVMMMIADAYLGYLDNIINGRMDAYILNVIICTKTESQQPSNHFGEANAVRSPSQQ